MGVGTSELFSTAGNYINHGYQNFIHDGRYISRKYLVHECPDVTVSVGELTKQMTVKMLLSDPKICV
jgi:hypothetical protein